MEQLHNALGMLDLMREPAFCVQNDQIIKVNSAAAALLLETGTDINTMLQTGAEEYKEFDGGCLYLTLSVSGQSIGASVVRMQEFDVFTMEQGEADAHLQAMALAAQELRGPLSNVMAVTDRLLPATALDESAREQAAHINKNLYQLMRIVSNMSDANLYTADTGTRQEVRNICALVGEAFQRAAALAAHTGITLNFTNHTENVYTLVDAQKLERAIFNILSNAIKATPSGGCISAALTRRGNKMYLSVCDSGSGIVEDLRGQVFSRYVRSASVTDGSSGLGLGMVLIRSTAALHGGTVLIDHPEHCGTRITVSFAIRQGNAAVRSPLLRVDYAGERDHGLIELSDVLPAYLYSSDKAN